MRLACACLTWELNSSVVLLFILVAPWWVNWDTLALPAIPQQRYKNNHDILLHNYAHRNRSRAP